MKKELSVFLLPICMVACSQESGIGENANTAVDMDSFAKVPVFAFGEDGSRYDVNLESGEQTKKEMNRERLVVADEDEFDSLKEKYRKLLNSEGASQIEYPLDYYCKAELLAINADYSEVVTSDGNVLLDDASLLEGCVDISKDETLAKKTMYTDYPSSRVLTQFPVRMYVESHVEKIGSTYEGIGVNAVYVYEKVGKDERFVPYEPNYASVYTGVFKKSACKTSNNGLTFSCGTKYSDYEFSGLCAYNKGDTPNEAWSHCQTYNYRYYGDETNSKFRAWSIDAEAGGQVKVYSKNALAAISLHVVVHGKDTVYFRTGVNVDKQLADKIYYKYMSDEDLFAKYNPKKK